MLPVTSVLDQLQRYLSDTAACRVRPPVECKDGFKMSVQAGMYHYCSPQNDVGPWTSVEVGFPSKVEPILWEYAEEPGKWTDTVFPSHDRTWRTVSPTFTMSALISIFIVQSYHFEEELCTETQQNLHELQSPQQQHQSER